MGRAQSVCFSLILRPPINKTESDGTSEVRVKYGLNVVIESCSVCITNTPAVQVAPLLSSHLTSPVISLHKIEISP